MKEVLIIKCEDKNEYIRSMATKMNDKFYKYWGESNLLMSIVTVWIPNTR
jgi:FMN-dependent NADH-azoreductase